MKPCWAGDKIHTAEHPLNGEDVPLYEYFLVLDPNGLRYILDSSSEVSGYRALTVMTMSYHTQHYPPWYYPWEEPPRPKDISWFYGRGQMGPFFSSPFAEGYPPTHHVFYDEKEAIKFRVKVHELLFTLLYALPASVPDLFEDMLPYVRWDDQFGYVWTENGNMKKPIYFYAWLFADLIACSEVYGVLDQLADSIAALILAWPGIWKDIKDSPTLYLVIGSKLWSEEIFADALRHCVGSNIKLEAWSAAGTWTTAEVALLMHPLRQNLQYTIDVVNRLLPGLTLNEKIPARYLSEEHAPFFSATKGRKSQAQTITFLAKSIFDDWLNAQLYHRYGVYKPSNLRASCMAIRDAAGLEDPTTIFGPNVAGKIAGVFRLGRPEEPIKKVKELLVQLIKQAADIVVGRDGLLLPPSNNTYQSQEAKCMEGCDYFTTMTIRPDDFPWKWSCRWLDYEYTETRWPCTYNIVRPLFSRRWVECQCPGCRWPKPATDDWEYSDQVYEEIEAGEELAWVLEKASVKSSSELWLHAIGFHQDGNAPYRVVLP